MDNFYFSGVRVTVSGCQLSFEDEYRLQLEQEVYAMLPPWMQILDKMFKEAELKYPQKSAKKSPSHIFI